MGCAILVPVVVLVLVIKFKFLNLNIYINSAIDMAIILMAVVELVCATTASLERIAICHSLIVLC